MQSLVTLNLGLCSEVATTPPLGHCLYLFTFISDRSQYTMAF